MPVITLAQDTIDKLEEPTDVSLLASKCHDESAQLVGRK